MTDAQPTSDAMALQRRKKLFLLAWLVGIIACALYQRVRTGVNFGSSLFFAGLAMFFGLAVRKR